MTDKQHNARIANTMLGLEGHGIMTWDIRLDWEGSSIGIGGYAIGGKSGIDSIKEILKTVGVDTWEELGGKYVVLEMKDGRANGIRNIIKEDQWFRPKEWFEARI